MEKVEAEVEALRHAFIALAAHVAGPPDTEPAKARRSVIAARIREFAPGRNPPEGTSRALERLASDLVSYPIREKR